VKGVITGEAVVEMELPLQARRSWCSGLVWPLFGWVEAGEETSTNFTFKVMDISRSALYLQKKY
jgi:hypothetical protein